MDNLEEDWNGLQLLFFLISLTHSAESFSKFVF